MNDMNYETDIAPRLAEGKNAATIASEINAERRALVSNYRTIKSHEVANWLATNGLEVRMERGVAALPDGDLKDSMAAALRGVQAIRGNVNATMSIAPGQQHRLLILGAIQAGIMLQSDLESADAIAYIGTVETAETVQAAIDLYNSDAAQWQRAVTAGALVIEAGGTFAEAMSAAGGV